jgi:hypothetical protein
MSNATEALCYLIVDHAYKLLRRPAIVKVGQDINIFELQQIICEQHGYSDVDSNCLQVYRLSSPLPEEGDDLQKLVQEQVTEAVRNNKVVELGFQKPIQGINQPLIIKLPRSCTSAFLTRSVPHILS